MVLIVKPRGAIASSAKIYVPCMGSICKHRTSDSHGLITSTYPTPLSFHILQKKPSVKADTNSFHPQVLQRPYVQGHSDLCSTYVNHWHMIFTQVHYRLRWG